jgi:membrane protease YdiL (CAAX protease family)
MKDLVRSEASPLIAAPIHTAIVIGVLALNAYTGMVRSDHMRHAATVNRVAMYRRTMIFEWVMLGVVLLGVWLHKTSLYTVLGERWRSATQVITDAGIALAFLVVSIAMTSLLGPSHPNGSATDAAVQFLLPQGRLETLMWICLSITAGICEEAIYRGYLQQQFVAMTRSVPIGIVLAALAFGVSHAYQGWRNAAMIAVGGAMAGALANWRKTVRPGMIAHAMQDTLAVFIKH